MGTSQWAHYKLVVFDCCANIADCRMAFRRENFTNLFFLIVTGRTFTLSSFVIVSHSGVPNSNKIKILKDQSVK